MTYTTHGLMTPADMADMRDLYDLDAGKDEKYHHCDGPKCPHCDGPLASDGVCADNSCQDEDEFQDLLDSIREYPSREGPDEDGWDRNGVNGYEL